MNTTEELSNKFHYLQALLVKHKSKSRSEEHICASTSVVASSRREYPKLGPYPFEFFVSSNADLLIRLAVDLLSMSRAMVSRKP